MKKNSIFLITLFICITIFLSINIVTQVLDSNKKEISALKKTEINCTYLNSSINNDIKEVTYLLRFFNENGIKTIEYNNTVLNCNNKTNVGIDLNVTQNIETIVKVTTLDGNVEEFPVEYIEDVNNIIIQSGYQKITNTGIIDTQEEITVSIEYADSSGINYYSINDGEWIEYTGILTNLNQNDCIKAKTVSSNKYGESATYEKTLPTSTKLPIEVYDKDDTTYVDGIEAAFLIVDDTMKGKNVKIKTRELNFSYRFFNIQSYDKIMQSKLLISAPTYEGSVTIPEDSAMISIYAQGRCRVFTIEPEI